MSRAAELARDEADAVEAAEAADDDEATGGEPAGGDEQPAGEPDEQPQGLDEKRLERELARHEREMAQILGPAFPDMAPCAVCEGFGYTPQRNERPPELLEDPMTARCPTCAGLGLLKTGSLREGQTERSCIDCSGNGYLTKTVQVPGHPPTTFAAGNAAAGNAAFDPGVPPDKWGRPWGHAHYGIEPALVGV